MRISPRERRKAEDTSWKEYLGMIGVGTTFFISTAVILEVIYMLTGFSKPTTSTLGQAAPFITVLSVTLVGVLTIIATIVLGDN